MMRLLGSLSPYYQPRIYVVAETDKMSAEKIISFEKKKGEEKSSEVCDGILYTVESVTMLKVREGVHLH